MGKTDLTSIGGELACPIREAEFQAERLPETLRHARLIIGCSVVLNSLFLLSDWRFSGQAQFWVAVPARLCVVAFSLLALAALRPVRSFGSLQRVLIGWEVSVAVGVAVLCTSRSSIALFVILLLPAIYILVVPTNFRWTAICGTFCVVALTCGYLLPPPLPTTAPGIAIGAVAGSVAFLLFVVRSNRTRRLEWVSTQAERSANTKLTESRALFESMFKAVPVPIIVSRQSDGAIVNGNDAGLAFFRLPSLAALTRCTTSDFVDIVERRMVQSELKQHGSVRDLEMTVSTVDGARRHILLSAEQVEVDGASCVISSLVDITDRKAVEERIRLAACHDVLTGLGNRALFQTTLDSALEAAQSSGSRVGLILLDLDAFKEVNDTLGHEAGDHLLKEVGQRLTGVLTPDDLVARLGGDEFVMIVDCAANPEEAYRHLHDLAGDILVALSPAFPIHDRVVVPRASLGLALFPDQAACAADLFKNADLALYEAKASGRNRAMPFAPAMRERIEERVTVTREMRVALAKGGLVPYYQPKVSLATGGVVGFEALARWQHPTRGLLAPAAFAHVFDDPEVGIAVGRHLTGQIFHDVAAWLAAGIDPGRVFLNLSSAQFAQDDLAETLIAAMDGVGLSHDRIGVEVTETVLLGGHGDRVARVLDALHAAGIRVALDDFGTGYASLTHLKQYPVDEIKVDRSFVRDLERDADDAAIVTAVLQLGRSLGLSVTAEGVETPAQVRFLTKAGCAYAQGYLYAKPMPSSRVPWFLENRPDLALDMSLPTGELKIA